MASSTFVIENRHGSLEVPALAFYEFMGIYLSEGCTTPRKDRANGYNICIFQNVGEDSTEIQRIINDLGIYFNVYDRCENEFGKVTRVWKSHNRILGEYLHQFGDCYTKYIDQHIFDRATPELAKAFLDAFILGDGRVTVYKGYTKQDCFSVSERLIMDISHMASIANIAHRVWVEERNHDCNIGDRVILAENRKPMFYCQLLTPSGVYLDNRFMSIREVDYDDNVYCLETANGNFYAMDGGYTFWTGNSPQINLDRVSHLITELKFDGNDIYGKAKILETPCGNIVRGLIKGGAKLGVSSRGVGSVVQKNGINEVQSDFRLITVDVVANPSAHAALVDGIMEGSEWICENGVWTERQIDHAKKILNAKYSEENAIRIFESFMRDLAHKTA